MEQIGSHRCFGGQQLRFTHRSETLDCDMAFSLYLPPQAEYAPVPLLHWQHQTWVKWRDMPDLMQAQRPFTIVGTCS